jgi:putative peptidoglycan lipid II flippase
MKVLPVQKLLTSWQVLTTGSTNRKIFGAAIMVALVTALVKVATVTKEVIVAWKFGTADALDAFIIAFVVPSFIINVIAGSFNAALIPTYIKVREQEGRNAAQKLFSGATVWSIGLLIIATVLLLIAAPHYLPIIAKGFSREKLDITFKLLYILAPAIILSGVTTLWCAVLNAGERFALTAISPIITPVISILFLLLANDWGVFALATGLVCGVLLEMISVGIGLHLQGISLLPRWYGFDTHLRQVVSQYTPVIAGACLISSAGLVDDSMAAMLLPGSVAALNYGNRITVLPINLAIVALRTVVTPYFSKMIAHEDWVGIHHTLKRYIKLIFIATIPLSILLIIFSEFIVRIFLQRGSFTSHDTYLVAQIQTCYALQIPFYIANILVVILVNSLKFNYILIRVSALNLLINIVFNYLFIQWMGVKGIALSTSCVYMFCFSYLFVFVNKKLSKTW